MERYNELKHFKSEKGHVNVPLNYTDAPGLDDWVRSQKWHYNLSSRGTSSALSPEQIEMLTELGFEWDLADEDHEWMMYFDDLEAFRSRKGHCQVPESFAENPQLGIWVVVQRLEYRNMKNGNQSSMTHVKRKLLEDIGFIWCTKGSRNGTKNGLKPLVTSEETEVKSVWHVRYEELKSFKSQKGHCDVPTNFTDNTALATWVNDQRKAYSNMKNGRRSTMTDEWIGLLEKIGFEWCFPEHDLTKVAKPLYAEARENDWMKRYQELKRFRSKEGHCNIPKGFIKNPQLAEWVRTQRRSYRMLKNGQQSPMNSRRLMLLEKIGFEWTPGVKEDIDQDWDVRYRMMEDFKTKEGHCNVPPNFTENPILSAWVHTQRVAYHKYKNGHDSPITTERIEKLEKLGFEWNVFRGTRVSESNEQKWLERYKDLEEFMLEEGHCYVPKNYIGNPSLYEWVHTQRTSFKRRMDGLQSAMTDERLARLEKLGFEWTRFDKHDASHITKPWMKRYEELDTYKRQNGNCNVPAVYNTNISLGIWVTTQRIEYMNMNMGRETNMNQKKIGLLNGIGFSW
mmetsp:Transcript_34745/g.42491  ORF Transcript_34745/g.42491 Transcript_34745/m.42491 type:complete len:566 (+) Transcript_34745:52-1749(+)